MGFAARAYIVPHLATFAREAVRKPLSGAHGAPSGSDLAAQMPPSVYPFDMKPSRSPSPALPPPCPCQSGLSYPACCGQWHRAQQLGQGLSAPSALALMRSRYSAFGLRNWAYLMATWHPSTRPPELQDEPGQTWLGLEIKGWGEQGDEAWVEFVARSKQGGRAHRLHERSFFVREDGMWLYVKGEIGPSKAQRP